MGLSIMKSGFAATPDAVISVTSMKGPRQLRLPFILECAFSQPITDVFNKVKDEIVAHPEVVMVVIVFIKEEPPFHSPKDRSEAWERFKLHPSPLELGEFLAACDDVEEGEIGRPIMTAGHTWCNISNIDYYVWLKKDGATIDIEDADKANESSVHGVSYILTYLPIRMLKWKFYADDARRHRHGRRRGHAQQRIGNGQALHS